MKDGLIVHVNIVHMGTVEFCQCAALPRDWLVEIVEHGILEPDGADPEHWLFDAQTLAVAQRARRLREDLQIEWDGIALALQLLDELDQLREENARLRRRLGRFAPE